MNTQKLREYLENIRLLEEDIYTIDLSISKLNASKKSVPEKVEYKAPDPPLIMRKPTLMSPSEQTAYDAWVSAKRKENQAAIKQQQRKNKISNMLYGHPEDTRVIEVFQGNTFSDWCKYTYATKTNSTNYPRELYEEDTKRYKDWEIRYRDYIYPTYLKQLQDVQEKEKQQEEKIAQIERYNLLLSEEIANLYDAREKTSAALSQLYSLDIVYRKYQEWIPVTMFCEYIDSGRRTELSGVNGMYDLYEQELLGKKILGVLGDINSNLAQINSQLGSISRQLTGIQRNQILVYEEVARGNEIANRICNNTSRQLEQAAILNNKADTIYAELNDLGKHVASIHSDLEVNNYRLNVLQRSADSIAKIEQYEFALKHPLFQNP